MLTGTHGTVLVWPYLESTISSTLLGSVLGLLLGLLAGLITSSNRLLAEVLGFFLVAANSVPRIALIPIVVLLAGVGFWTSVWATVMVVFFLAYFSSFEGGSRVPKAILESAAVMKASRGRIMFGIRLPYVALWTSAAIPNAISFGLITAVTTELLSGGQGIGQLMLVATANLDSTGTFAVVTLLSLVGLIMLSGTEWLKRKLLAWAVD
jgi:NitT/TauT family transport system permease protein